jgi:hypothetical protein
MATAPVGIEVPDDLPDRQIVVPSGQAAYPLCPLARRIRLSMKDMSSGSCNVLGADSDHGVCRMKPPRPAPRPPPMGPCPMSWH